MSNNRINSDCGRPLLTFPRKIGPLIEVSFPAKSTSESSGGFVVKKTYSTEEQVAFALQQAGHGTPVKEVTHKMVISEQTFYRWRRKYGGLGTSELCRLKIPSASGSGLDQPSNHDENATLISWTSVFHPH